MNAKSGELCIPIAAVALPGVGDEMGAVNPSPGDPVEFQAAGTVTRIEGGNAYVKLDTANGQPVVNGDMGAESMTVDDELAQMEAELTDQQPSY